jgi:pimeloyl-ACP methyl ester carboxylesterase
MPTDTGLGQWANPKVEREYADLCAALRREAWQALCDEGWGAPPAEIDVETRFGTTRAYHWRGDGDGVPIVLLHGAGTSSLMWAYLLARLVGSSVYALDTIGDPGASVQCAPIRDRDDLAAWLDGTLDGLAVVRAHLVGASYGGYIAVGYATRSPQRVASLALVEPVLDRLRPGFWIHGISTGLALLTPPPVRRRALHRLHMEMLATDDKRIRRMALLGQARHRRGLPGPVPITDEELASITARTLLLLGEESPIHRSRQLLQRATAAMPDLTAALIPNAGHSVPVDQAEEVARRLRAFLGQPSPR